MSLIIGIPKSGQISRPLLEDCIRKYGGNCTYVCGLTDMSGKFKFREYSYKQKDLGVFLDTLEIRARHNSMIIMVYGHNERGAIYDCWPFVCDDVAIVADWGKYYFVDRYNIKEIEKNFINHNNSVLQFRINQFLADFIIGSSSGDEAVLIDRNGNLQIARKKGCWVDDIYYSKNIFYDSTPEIVPAMDVCAMCGSFLSNLEEKIKDCFSCFDSLWIPVAEEWLGKTKTEKPKPKTTKKKSKTPLYTNYYI